MRVWNLSCWELTSPTQLLPSSRVFLESWGRPWIQMRSSLPPGSGRSGPGPQYPYWEASQSLRLPNTGTDPGKALSHLQGSWPQVPHPRLHTEEQSRWVIQQGESSESSGALHHPAGALPSTFVFLAPGSHQWACLREARPAPALSAECFLEALRIRCLRDWQASPPSSGTAGVNIEMRNELRATWPQRAPPRRDPHRAQKLAIQLPNLPV